jgi:hypothetical protein
VFSPRKHPNAYAGFSSAALTTFLVAEAKNRFGIDLTLEEAGFIVGAVTSIALFVGKRVGAPKA